MLGYPTVIPKDPKEIVAMIQEELVETCDRIFTPLVTLCTFLG